MPGYARLVHNSRAAVAVAAGALVLAVAITVTVVVVDHGPAVSPEARIAKCAAMEPRARCEFLEREAILCDSGYPFCGHADTAERRIFLCRQADISYHESASECARLDQRGQLCEDGSGRDPDPLFGEPGQCHYYEHRSG